jgi:hypothetical protein
MGKSSEHSAVILSRCLVLHQSPLAKQSLVLASSTEVIPLNNFHLHYPLTLYLLNWTAVLMNSYPTTFTTSLSQLGQTDLSFVGRSGWLCSFREEMDAFESELNWKEVKRAVFLVQDGEEGNTF